MKDEIIFYHNPMSRAVIAHWMLEEVGAPYRVELLRLDVGEHKRPEYLKINPMGKVPTIVHRDVVVTEAAAICAYLADAFPEAGLAPKLDDRARGSYLRWLFFGTGCIEPAVSDKMQGRPPVSKSTVAWGSYEDVLDALETALKPGPYVLGERFSAADVYVGSQIGWGLMMKGIEPRPLFTAYHERLSVRPAFQRVTAQNNELAKKLKT